MGEVPNTIPKICYAVLDAAEDITERPAGEVKSAPATTQPVAIAILLTCLQYLLLTV